MRFLLARRILLRVGFLLYNRLEAALDSYKSGTRAASDSASHWFRVLMTALWWVFGWRGIP